MKSLELLTQRERECLSLVDRHFSSKQIARELGMSKTSVDTYCDRARKKLGVTDRYTAARLLRDAGLDPVLIESGHDTVRTDALPENWLGTPATAGGSDGSATELREQSGDRPGAAPASGNRRLRNPVAGSGEAGRIAPGLL
ncbi:MAG: response regulator transcription factor, partial [Alphaproteobacteria bacterium]